MSTAMASSGSSSSLSWRLPMKPHGDDEREIYDECADNNYSQVITPPHIFLPVLGGCYSMEGNKGRKWSGSPRLSWRKKFIGAGRGLRARR